MRQRSQLARTLGRDGQHLNYITISKSFNMKCLVLALLVVGAASTALAQDGRPSQAPPRPRYAAALVAGASQFDLSGTGTTPVVGARVEAEVTSWLIAEGALGVIRPTEQFSRPALFTIPEAQLQVQWRAHGVRPYLGAGGGWVIASGGSTGTLSGAGGVRVAVPKTRIDARGELRVRGIGASFTASTAEWTLGAAYRF